MRFLGDLFFTVRTSAPSWTSFTIMRPKLGFADGSGMTDKNINGDKYMIHQLNGLTCPIFPFAFSIAENSGCLCGVHLNDLRFRVPPDHQRKTLAGQADKFSSNVSHYACSAWRIRQPLCHRSRFSLCQRINIIGPAVFLCQLAGDYKFCQRSADHAGLTSKLFANSCTLNQHTVLRFER